MTNKQILIGIRIFFRILIPIVLIILPVTFFDNGKSICLSVLLFNRECPACGLTRACMHLIHLDFEGAFEYNMMCFITFPVLAAFWAAMFFKEVKTFRKLLVLNKPTQNLTDMVDSNIKS